MHSCRALLGICLLGLSACGSVSDENPPTGTFTYTCDEFVCVFDATVKQGEVDGSVGVSWTFGDGTSGRGDRVEHVFRSDGEFEVTLGVIDEVGNSSTTSQTLTIDSVPAATYLVTVRSLLGGLIQTAESIRNIEAQAVPLQAEIEASLSAENLPADLACSESGTATVTAWGDDGDNVIETDEAIRAELHDCAYDPNAHSLDANEGVRIIGPVDSDQYRIAASERQRGLKAVAYGSYRLGGEFDVTRRPAATERLISGNSLQFYRFNSSGNRTSSFRFSSPDLILTTDFSEFSGAMGIAGDNIFGEWQVTIDQPVQISEVNGEFNMVAGKLILQQDTGAQLIVEPDADPAYLRLRYFPNNAVSPTMDSRLDQDFVTRRLGEF